MFGVAVFRPCIFVIARCIVARCIGMREVFNLPDAGDSSDRISGIWLEHNDTLCHPTPTRYFGEASAQNLSLLGYKVQLLGFVNYRGGGYLACFWCDAEGEKTDPTTSLGLIVL